MSIFKKFFKKKEDKKMATTLEEVRKAYENLSDDDRKKFHQSIADRVHESIAAQEVDSGTKDSQSAEAREHEALGAEHADGKGNVAELHESDDTSKERREDNRDKSTVPRENASNTVEDDWRKRYDERMSKLEATVTKLAEDSQNKIANAAAKYGMQSMGAPVGGKVYTADDVKNLLG